MKFDVRLSSLRLDPEPLRYVPFDRSNLSSAFAALSADTLRSLREMTGRRRGARP